jgi:hypothetical protein
MKWKTFFKTLGMAAVGGAVTTTVAAITSGTFDPVQLKYAAIGGSAAAAMAYLKQSPLGHYFPPPQDPPKIPSEK